MKPCARTGWLQAFLCLALLAFPFRISATGVATTTPLAAAEIEAIALAAMQEFQVPGMAVGVVKDDAILHAAGYGLREFGQSEPIDTETLFRIASNTKAFTTTALAMLVEEGKLGWDDRLIDHLPEFRLHDPWITAHFTVIDMLTHRSGLPPFAGDILLWPQPNDYTPADILFALRHFEFATEFRASYAYDNLLYVVAGELAGRVSGQAWNEFVDQRIMARLGLRHCFAGPVPAEALRNTAAPHGLINGKLQVIERGRIPREPENFAAAGGIACSLGDMLTWVRTQLAQGLAPDGQRLFSEASSQMLWRGVTPQQLNASERELHGTRFKAYALGFRVRDFHGQLEVSHTGTLAGMLSAVVMLPESGLAVVVLSNGNDDAAREVVMDSILQSFLPIPQRDWLAWQREQKVAVQPAAAAAPSVPPCNCPHRQLSGYAGPYRDAWFGEVHISLDQDGNELRFKALRSPRLAGVMQHVAGDTFRVRWDDASVDVEAELRFEPARDGSIPSFTIGLPADSQATWPDFQNAHFLRQE